MDLRERKRQRAREAIVAAAYELFAERGFTEVTVTDIAERAEVGRTTFFRYFGDKQEVLFAEEESLLVTLAVRLEHLPRLDEPALPGVVAQVRQIMGALCAEVTKDPERYTAHERLVEQHRELQERAVLKQQRYTAALRAFLLERGASPATAALAAQLGLACFLTGRELAGLDPGALAESVDAAFGRLSELGPHG